MVLFNGLSDPTKNIVMYLDEKANKTKLLVDWFACLTYSLQIATVLVCWLIIVKTTVAIK